MNPLRRLKGFRTILFNGVAVVPVLLEVVGTVANLPEVRGIIPPNVAPFYALGLAVMNIFLRTKTTTPLGKRI